MSITIKSTFLDHDLIVTQLTLKLWSACILRMIVPFFFLFSIRMLSESGLLGTMETFSVL